MEKLFLRPFLLGEKLDVVDEQHVDVSEFVAEAAHAIVTKGVDHLVGEFLAREIANRCVWLSALYFMTNCLHQVRLAHTDATVEEERVIGFRGPFRNRLCGRVRKLVSRADHKGVKSVFGIQLRSEEHTSELQS